MKLVSLAVFTALFSLSANAADVFQTIHDGVDTATIWSNLRQMTGYDPVTLGGETFSIHERKSDIDKQHFRELFIDLLKNIGLSAQEMPYTDNGGGTNVEAILPGKSADSVVVISHYDSYGAEGNPAVDDAASGVAVMVEAARTLFAHRTELQYTVRFVIADHEEDGGSGDYAYADYIAEQMKTGNFKVPAAIDYDQSGWISPDNDGHQFDIYYSDADATKNLIALALDTAKTYSPELEPRVTTLGDAMVDSDFLDNDGIPGICPSERNNARNPYKDVAGDTFDIITRSYYESIAKYDVTYLARVTLGGYPTQP